MKVPTVLSHGLYRSTTFSIITACLPSSLVLASFMQYLRRLTDDSRQLVPEKSNYLTAGNDDPAVERRQRQQQQYTNTNVIMLCHNRDIMQRVHTLLCSRIARSVHGDAAQTTYTFRGLCVLGTTVKKVKVAHTRLSSVGFRS